MTESDNYQESRRANRLEWQRTVKILNPEEKPATVVNVSASGCLLETGGDMQAEIGDKITFEVPHLYREEVMNLTGQIVRLEKKKGRLFLGIDLIS